MIANRLKYSLSLSLFLSHMQTHTHPSFFEISPILTFKSLSLSPSFTLSSSLSRSLSLSLSLSLSRSMSFSLYISLSFFIYPSYGRSNRRKKSFCVTFSKKSIQLSMSVYPGFHNCLSVLEDTIRGKYVEILRKHMTQNELCCALSILIVRWIWRHTNLIVLLLLYVIPCVVKLGF